MPMDKAEEAHQWKITTFAVIGALIAALIGGGLSLLGTIIALNQQQQALEQQQSVEQQNIAHAIYIDILNIELNLNDSIRNMNYSTSELDNPSFVSTYTNQYYNNWLYPIFGKDIAGFDNATSEDLYDFYGEVVDIENKREFVFTIMGKYLRGEKIAPYDLILAHEYTKSLYTIMIPDCILQAEKIKRELRLKYHVKTELIPKILYSSHPQTIDLQGIKIFVP